MTLGIGEGKWGEARARARTRTCTQHRPIVSEVPATVMWGAAPWIFSPRSDHFVPVFCFPAFPSSRIVFPDQPVQHVFLPVPLAESIALYAQLLRGGTERISHLCRVRESVNKDMLGPEGGRVRGSGSESRIQSLLVKCKGQSRAVGPSKLAGGHGRGDVIKTTALAYFTVPGLSKALREEFPRRSQVGPASATL